MKGQYAFVLGLLAINACNQVLSATINTNSRAPLLQQIVELLKNTGSNCNSYSPRECPAANGDFAVYLPHETDCTRFYECVWGEKVLQACPPGLHYNRKISVCTTPDDAQCTGCVSDTESKDSDNGETDRENGCQNVRKPSCYADDQGNAILYPHEKDCSLYYACNWGTPIVMHCPPGLQFNEIAQACDYPENVDCTRCGDDNDSEGDDDSSEEDGGDDSCEDVIMECPPTNEGDVTQFPNNKDCSSFYKCNLGKPVLIQCPAGLIYNRKLRVCDFPEHTTCNTCTDGDSEGSSEESSGGSSEVDECPTVNDSQCPDNNDGDVVQLPNPKDCSSFYKCNYGKLVLQLCPPGLQYNKNLRVCDYPESAQCHTCE